MDRRRYPEGWERVSLEVRERAGWRCECHGECGSDHEREAGKLRCTARHAAPHPITGSTVVLTVAHLWRGPCAEHHAAGVKCDDPEHLAAMCQRCHLRYDLEHHVANARATRRARRACGDLFD